MPKTTITILATSTITRDEQVTLALDVPQDVLDEGEEAVRDWLDDIMDNAYDDSLSPADRAVRDAVLAADWDVTDEDSDVEYDEVTFA